MSKFDGILSGQPAGTVSTATRELCPGNAGPSRLAPAAAGELPPPPPGRRRLVTRAAPARLTTDSRLPIERQRHRVAPLDAPGPASAMRRLGRSSQQRGYRARR